ncbi:glycosyltransferase family 2 protein [Dongia soli]|uniref:Glycosyltransferase family 2 protein n=1 Tax=Dongia soli TaxID=600628 RepID=A0ABU5ED32_9PROT|nr:glycosyltransferase family 2 protein [Dongia soli]MDY0884067.1 glycosyltransferase family 2 protein [Dongia soli]
MMPIEANTFYSDTSGDTPAISVVTSVYRSESFLPSFIEQIESTIREIGIAKYELIFVNDGSPDASLEYLVEAREQNQRIKIVDLSRNFGHHKALIAGLAHARGELTFLIDCDLEVAPNVLEQFVSTMKRNDVDAVYGFQEQRKGGIWERVTGQTFWWLFNQLSHTAIPPNVLTERLLTRRYVDALLSLGDRNIFLGGMMYWSGFAQLGIPIRKSQRQSKSSYSFIKKLSIFTEAITSFSAAPLHAILLLGVLITSGACLAAIYLVFLKLASPAQIVSGYTSLMLAVLGMGGLVVTVLGVVGLYVSHIFVQTQNRPLYIVRRFLD